MRFDAIVNRTIQRELDAALKQFSASVSPSTSFQTYFGPTSKLDILDAAAKQLITLQGRDNMLVLITTANLEAAVLNATIRKIDILIAQQTELSIAA